MEYVQSHEMKQKPDCLYFSLGDKESATGNPILNVVQQNTQERMESWIRCFEKLKLSGVIFAGGVTNKGDIDHHPALPEAYEAGKNL